MLPFSKCLSLLNLFRELLFLHRLPSEQLVPPRECRLCAPRIAGNFARNVSWQVLVEAPTPVACVIPQIFIISSSTDSTGFRVSHRQRGRSLSVCTKLPLPPSPLPRGSANLHTSSLSSLDLGLLRSTCRSSIGCSPELFMRLSC